MSRKERQRYYLLKIVLESKITLNNTISVMGVSCRHAKWLKKKLISEWAKGLIYGNRGRPLHRGLSGELAAIRYLIFQSVFLYVFAVFIISGQLSVLIKMYKALGILF